MISITRGIAVLFCMTTLAGCNAFGNYERPDVNITSFNLAPETPDTAPGFDIGIQIINPGSRPLPLRGISYSLEIEGQRILNGAKPDLPQIPAYSTADFVIRASPDLLGSARLIADLFSQPRDNMEFVFRATIDSGTLMPLIRIEESGNFNPDTAAP